MNQIKKVGVAIDEHMKQNDAELQQYETDRNEALKEIGNLLHESCIISNDEVGASIKFSSFRFLKALVK